MSFIISTEPSGGAVQLDIATTPIVNGNHLRVLFEDANSKLNEDLGYQYDPSNGKLTAPRFSSTIGIMEFPAGGARENEDGNFQIDSNAINTPNLITQGLDFRRAMCSAEFTLTGTTTTFTSLAASVPGNAVFVICRRTFGTAPGFLICARASSTSITVTSSSAIDNGRVTVFWFRYIAN